MRPNPLLLAPLLALAPLASAQIHLVKIGGVEIVEWDPAHGSGTFRNAVLADLDGDGLPDGVTLRGDQVVYCHDVDVFTNLVHVAGGVNAMTLAGGTVPTGGGAPPEGIAVVTAQGLHFYEIDTSGGAIVPMGTILDTGAWAGAVDVQRANVDGDIDYDLFGLSSDRSNLLIMPRVGSGWGASTTIPLPETVISVAMLQWDGDDEKEIVVVTATHAVKVFDDDGSGPLFSRGNPFDLSLVTVLPESSGSGTDRVAFYLGNSSGTIGFLIVFDRHGTEKALPFAGEVPYALSAHDLVGDGQPDLAITFTSQNDVLLAENVYDPGVLPPYSASFDLGDPNKTFYLGLFDLLPPFGPANNAPVRFGDGDGDGSDDLFLASDAGGGSALVHGPFGVGAAVNKPTIVKGSSNACVDAPGLARVTFDMSYQDPAPEVEEFEVSVFLQASSDVDTDPQAVSTCYVDRDDNLFEYVLDVYLPAGGPPFPSYLWTSEDPAIYHMVIRPVDANRKPADATLIATFTLDPPGLWPLSPALGWEEGPDAMTDLVDCGTSPAGGWPTGGVLAHVRIPSLPGGEIPSVADECSDPTP